MLSPYHLLVKKTEQVLSFAERMKEKLQRAEHDLIRQVKHLLHEGSQLSHYHPDAMKYLEHASELCCYLHPRVQGKDKDMIEILYKQVEHERWTRVYYKATRDQSSPDLKKEAVSHLNELANTGFKPTVNFFKQQNIERAFKIAMRQVPDNEYVSLIDINKTVNELAHPPYKGA